jgi:hypothetical protein
MSEAAFAVAGVACACALLASRLATPLLFQLVDPARRRDLAVVPLAKDDFEAMIETTTFPGVRPLLVGVLPAGLAAIGFAASEGVAHVGVWACLLGGLYCVASYPAILLFHAHAALRACRRNKPLSSFAWA